MPKTYKMVATKKRLGSWHTFSIGDWQTTILRSYWFYNHRNCWQSPNDQLLTTGLTVKKPAKWAEKILIGFLIHNILLENQNMEMWRFSSDKSSFTLKAPRYLVSNDTYIPVKLLSL